MIVTGTNQRDWTKDDGTTVKVTDVRFDDGREVPGYDLPSQPEVGKPLPEGWEVATSKAGKPYIKVPKPRGGGGFGGGAAAHRNTKEGQAYEQERMDRRTALMQAVAIANEAKIGDEGMPWGPWVITTSGLFYDWLRQTSPVAPQTSSDGGKNGGSTPSSERTGEDTSPEAGSLEGGPATGTCPKDSHLGPMSPLNPAGVALPAGRVMCVTCKTVVKEGT